MGSQFNTLQYYFKLVAPPIEFCDKASPIRRPQFFLLFKGAEEFPAKIIIITLCLVWGSGSRVAEGVMASLCLLWVNPFVRCSRPAQCAFTFICMV
jgi:hypothetical protein